MTITLIGLFGNSKSCFAWVPQIAIRKGFPLKSRKKSCEYQQTLIFIFLFFIIIKVRGIVIIATRGLLNLTYQ